MITHVILVFLSVVNASLAFSAIYMAIAMSAAGSMIARHFLESVALIAVIFIVQPWAVQNRGNAKMAQFCALAPLAYSAGLVGVLFAIGKFAVVFVPAV